MTAQLVVISGKKMPRPAYRAGMLFLRNISTNCTREAITRIKATVRRYSRPNFCRKKLLVIQVITPAITSTKTTAMAMPTAVSIFLDVPRNGQFPRNWASKMLFIRIQLIARTIKSPIMISYFLPTRFIRQSIRPRATNAPGASTIKENG